MAFAPPAVSAANAGPNPTATTTLSSNNPFRRTSPSSGDTDTPRQNAGVNARPVSRNPFLDDYNVENRGLTQQRSSSPTKPIAPVVDRSQKPLPANGAPVDLMSGLTLSEQSASSRNIDPRARPPPQHGPVPKHQTTRSQDDEGPARVERPPGRSKPRPIDGVVSTKNMENGRPRRNSEASAVGSDEERKRRERRLREREARHRDKDGKPRPPKPKRPNRKIDLIDRLDVTGVYGGGFHHDGPFDACHPQRNRKGMKTAPMQAFPEGSANMAIGGTGPVNKGLDFDRIHGISAEGFTDYNTTTVDPYEAQKRAILARQYIINPREVHAQVHGEESAGLGTSTFLEGAPASRVSMQRRESEAADVSGGPGIQRSKSIVQKIRGISRPRQNSNELGRVVTPEARYAYADGEPSLPDGVRTAPIGPHTAGGQGKMSEINPFFADPERNGANGVKSTEQEEDTKPVEQARPPGSPTRGVLRRVTTQDSTETPEQKAGLLSRVKSLKGGKRIKPERWTTDTQE